VIANGYRGWIGIEYEGTRLPADEGVAATKRLMDRILAERASGERPAAAGGGGA